MGISSSQTLGAGHAVHNSILAHHSMGGMLVLVLAGLWMARKHLRAVFSKAFFRSAEVDDSDEIISYRTAVFMLLGGCVVLVGWLALGVLVVACEDDDDTTVYTTPAQIVELGEHAEALCDEFFLSPDWGIDDCKALLEKFRG